MATAVMVGATVPLSQPSDSSLSRRLALTGNGTGQNYTVYGRVPPQTTPAPGTYTDTITVKVANKDMKFNVDNKTTVEARGAGTHYTATAIHRDEAGRKRHEEMGFFEGWGKCLDQLVALVKTM